MSKQDIKQLRNRDPEKRKIAIKRIARDVDQNALHQLAKMSGDDPDPEVRKLALSAGVYIREKMDGGKDGNEKVEVAVPQRQIDAAQSNVNAAMTFHIEGDDEKSVSLLYKALNQNPNLRHDDYFISLAASITGAEDKKAVDALTPIKPEKKGLGRFFGR